MKIKIQGYDVECTPSEFSEFLKLKQVCNSSRIEWTCQCQKCKPINHWINTNTQITCSLTNTKDFTDKIVDNLKNKSYSNE